MGGIIYHCAECGRRLSIVDGYAICPRCHFDLTGEDDGSERREDHRWSLGSGSEEA